MLANEPILMSLPGLPVNDVRLANRCENRRECAFQNLGHEASKEIINSPMFGVFPFALRLGRLVWHVNKIMPSKNAVLETPHSSVHRMLDLVLAISSKSFIEMGHLCIFWDDYIPLDRVSVRLFLCVWWQLTGSITISSTRGTLSELTVRIDRS